MKYDIWPIVVFLENFAAGRYFAGADDDSGK